MGFQLLSPMLDIILCNCVPVQSFPTGTAIAQNLIVNPGSVHMAFFFVVAFIKYSPLRPITFESRIDLLISVDLTCTIVSVPCIPGFASAVISTMSVIANCIDTTSWSWFSTFVDVYREI